MTGGNLSCVKASDDLMTVMKFFALRENPISVFFYTAVGGSLKKMYQGFFFQYPLYKTEKNAQMSVTRARNQQEIKIINYD